MNPKSPFIPYSSLEYTFFHFNADKVYSYMVINSQKNSDAS